MFYPGKIIKLCEPVHPAISRDGTSIPQEKIIRIKQGTYGLIISGVNSTFKHWPCVLCGATGRNHYRNVLFDTQTHVVPVCSIMLLDM